MYLSPTWESRNYPKKPYYFSLIYMCVVWMHACIFTWRSAYTHVCSHVVCGDISTCMCVCVFIYMSVHAHVCSIQVCKHEFLHLGMYIYTFVRAYVFTGGVYMHLHVYVYVYVCLYVRYMFMHVACKLACICSNVSMHACVYSIHACVYSCLYCGVCMHACMWFTCRLYAHVVQVCVYMDSHVGCTCTCVYM